MISSSNIDQLTPDFLLDSGLVMLVVLDIDGKVLSTNHFLSEKSGLKRDRMFVEVLPAQSKLDFERILDEIILSPKKNYHLSLEFNHQFSEVTCQGSWEFSVVTDSEMDIMGVGIDPNVLSPKVKIDGLVDLLGLGRITLDSSFRILDGDLDQLQKLGLTSEDAVGMNILNLFPQLGLERILSTKDATESFFKTEVKFGSQRFKLLGFKEFEKYHLFFSELTLAESEIFSVRKPFSRAQIAAIPGAVWVLDTEGVVIQQNVRASNFSVENLRHESTVGCKFKFNGAEFFQKFKAFQAGENADFVFNQKIEGVQSKAFSVHFGRLYDQASETAFILLHVNDLALNPTLQRLQQENIRLKDIALRPSYVLRSPLSSMLGLLDLIDPEQLDMENKKYFSYLKPLATELDEVIRNNAKRTSTLD